MATLNDYIALENDCKRLEAENAQLRAMLKECSDDLEAEVEGHYQGVKDHPAMARRYERDIEPVRRARELLKTRE